MSYNANQRLRIGLLTYKIVAWVCIIFFFGCSVAAFFARQYGPAAFFWAFIALGIYILVSSGYFELDENGVSQNNMFGQYRMHWSEIRRIEVGTQGTLVLHGEGKRFVLAPVSVWSGQDKAEAFKLLTSKINELEIIPEPSNVADYKIHKNTKVKAVTV